MVTTTHTGRENLKLGSLFTGMGGLDLAVEKVFNATTVWTSDIELGPNKIIAHRFPHAPNLGDITTVDWSQVEPVDIVAGASPCQDVSLAGRRAGMAEGTESNLWGAMREAIAVLKPSYVVWENVIGVRSAYAQSASDSPMEPGQGRVGEPNLRALGRVLGDLASLGYDAQWRGVRASDVGAPHRRLRIFVVAYTHGLGREEGGHQPSFGERDGEDPYAFRTNGRPLPSGSLASKFGHFAPLIERWERVMGRPAPFPTEPGVRHPHPRLSPRFSEWLMGLPEGWVTDVPKLSRTRQLRALGNGTVPLQAEAAIRDML